MMNEMRVWVIVAAGGSGSRFRDSGGFGGADRDKLSEDLGGRAVVRRSVELFTKRAEVSGVVVVGPKAGFDAFKLKHGDALGMLGCVLVPGGETERWESVRAGLEAVPGEATHVAVHDAARPNVSERLLDRVFASAERYDAVVPGVEVRDTLKRVEAESEGPAADALDAILGDAGKAASGGRRVVGTVERGGLVGVQTPQVFEAGLLRRAYGQDDLNSTDDAGLVERLGEPVMVVEGEASNVKITTPEDLAVVRALMGVSGRSERPAHKRF